MKQKTYWENLTAPLTEGDKFVRYWGCCLFGISMVCILIYKFKTDVSYDLQFQLTFISKKYYWLNSNLLCMWLIVVMLIGIIIKRWWYWFVNNIWLTLLLVAKNKMEDINVYKNAMINGIIMIREYFNYSCNFYLYKSLTPEQVMFCVKHEFRTRYNSISFLTYKDCRYGFVKDPWVDHFFHDFFLDHNDVKSFERIRAQIEFFQKNKIDQAHKYMDIRDLEYIRDHPVKYYLEKYSDIVGNFFYEYTGHLIVGSFLGLILASVLWYNLVEDPNIRQNILAIWNRWVDNGFNPSINPRGPEIPIDSLSYKLIQIFGKDNPKEYLVNLQSLITQNAELLRHFSESPFLTNELIKSLGPELAHKAYSSLLPQTITQMVPQMLQTQALCEQIIEKIAQDMNYYSPFEQFEVIILQRVSFFGIDLSFTNLTLFLVISLSVIVFFSHVISKSLNLIPNYWQSVIEIFYSFIFSMLIDQAGKKAKVFFPAIFSVFFFILVNNLLGLIPLSFAVTSHVVITFCLGFGFFVAWVIVAFKTIGLKVFNIFWPTNVPLWLRPLLMVVEILSFSLRPFSLSIRLFVNMLAGHVLLHLVGGSVVLVFSKAALFSFIPFILLLAVFCLELGIAFLQAYIFSILLCIYLHDSYHVHGH